MVNMFCNFVGKKLEKTCPICEVIGQVCRAKQVEWWSCLHLFFTQQLLTLFPCTIEWSTMSAFQEGLSEIGSHYPICTIHCIETANICQGHRQLLGKPLSHLSVWASTIARRTNKIAKFIYQLKPPMQTMSHFHCIVMLDSLLVPGPFLNVVFHFSTNTRCDPQLLLLKNPKRVIQVE